MKQTIYNEQSAVNLDVSFLDTDGSAYTPTTLHYTVHDSETSTLMQAQTSLSPASSLTFTVPATANVINDDNKAVEQRTVTITVNDGLTDEFNTVKKYNIRNFKFVT